jgi:hypothetical protein
LVVATQTLALRKQGIQADAEVTLARGNERIPARSGLVSVFDQNLTKADLRLDSASVKKTKGPLLQAFCKWS